MREKEDNIEDLVKQIYDLSVIIMSTNKRCDHVMFVPLPYSIVISFGCFCFSDMSKSLAPPHPPNLYIIMEISNSVFFRCL